MKRYCIVSFCNLYILPYAKTYINMILSNAASCDLVYWDRDIGDSKDCYPGCTIYPFKYPVSNRTSVLKKFIGYFLVTRFINTAIDRKDYDGIFFLQSHAAVSCIGILKNRYKNKYILDIRDYSLENFFVYRKLEEKVINNAYQTIISSPAYKKFLPTKEYVVAHNYNPFVENEIKRYNELRKNQLTNKIRISFVGTIRFIDMDKKILTLFANDKRYIINYFGRGAELLRDYCETMNIENVNFYGSFNPSQTIDFYADTDLINNLYGNHTPFLDYALSNKLYHSALLRLPILVCPGTYMAELSSKYGIGYVLDVEDAYSPDKLFQWFTTLDVNKLNEGAAFFIRAVEAENDFFFKTITSFIQKNSNSQTNNALI